MLRKSCGLLIILILIVSSGVVHADGEFAVDSPAKQLVSPGWEEVEPEADTPMVVYELRLVELSSYVSSVIDGAVEITVDSNSQESQEAQAGYSVLTDRVVLSWIGGYPGIFKGEIEGQKDTRVTGSGYDAWLVTMGHNPVTVELSEGSILDDPEEGGSREHDQVLKITMTPQQIYGLGGGVLTDIALDYLSPAGTLGKARMTTLLESVADKPLALVIQETKSRDRKSRRYFGLYASATTMAASALPQRGPLVSMGNIKGLQGLLMENATGQEQGPSWNQFRLDVGQRQGELSIAVGAEFERDRYRVYGYADGLGSGVGYGVGADYRLYDTLSLAAFLTHGSSADSVLRLGVSDKVYWGENLELEAAYLPITYRLKEGQLDSRPWLQLTLTVKQTAWDAWYQCVYDNGDFEHNLGVAQHLSPIFDLRLLWSRRPVEGDYYGLGVALKLE
ncbi:MAG: hypothetical protein GX986_04995 [Firmicutes bacterium]|nr:hypothetical protein [Bacillota bacterium]